MDVPSTKFKVKKKVVHHVHVHCHGHVKASISDMSLDLVMVLSNNVTYPVVRVVSANTQIGNVHVSHHMDDTACKVADKVIEEIVGNIDHKIQDTIKEKVGPAIDGAIQPAIAEALSHLTLKKTIADTPLTVLDYSLAGPIITNVGGITFGFKAFVDRPHNPIKPVPFAPMPEPGFSRDVGLMINQGMFNQASEALAVNKLHGHHKVYMYLHNTKSVCACKIWLSNRVRVRS